MKFYLREKFCFSGIFLCVAISTKSLQCTDFEIMVGLSDWLVICPLGLQVKIKTAAQPQCMKSAYNHQHELLHTSWLLYLFVWLIHVQPLRFSSWWGLKQYIQQNQHSSLLNQVSVQWNINLWVSYSLIHKSLITQTRK